MTLEILAKIVLRNPEPNIVVTVVWVVVVAVGRAEILRIVVPRTAAKDTTGRSSRPAQDGQAQKNHGPIPHWQLAPRESYPPKKFAARLRRIPFARRA